MDERPRRAVGGSAGATSRPRRRIRTRSASGGPTLFGGAPTAGLFHSYAVQRPALLASWEAGRPGDGSSHWPDAIGGGSWPDGIGGTPRCRPRLATAALAGAGSSGSGTTPVERHTQTVMRLRDGDPSLDLPERDVAVRAHAIGSHRDRAAVRPGERHQVDLWPPHPSPALWAKLMPSSATARPARSGRVGTIVAHPLLASLGRDLRSCSALSPCVGRRRGAPARRGGTPDRPGPRERR